MPVLMSNQKMSYRTLPKKKIRETNETFFFLAKDAVYKSLCACDNDDTGTPDAHTSFRVAVYVLLLWCMRIARSSTHAHTHAAFVYSHSSSSSSTFTTESRLAKAILLLSKTWLIDSRTEDALRRGLFFSNSILLGV